ncbi:biotin transporter BioY [Micropruina sp.]|uniref:biotin transporter BioY n=1 Tax=Micropruina sp. TaxID=2737536 RepID=UPI0026035DF3|nr:biotin transporter BioY [Micropruina sp.]
MSAGKQPTTDLALIAVFAALIAVFSVVPGVPVGPVPITLQTLAVILSGLVLGPWRGFAAAALYLLVGFAGLPVFAGGAGGLGVLAKPSIGYLLSFPIAALLAGVFARWLAGPERRARFLWLFLSGFGASVLIVHPAGILGLMVVAQMSVNAAIATDLVFWPGDVVKNLVAAAIAVAVHKAFPALLAARAPVAA